MSELPTKRIRPVSEMILDAKLSLALKIIEEYAQHYEWCASITKLGEIPPINAEWCTCGLAEKWKELNK